MLCMGISDTIEVGKKCSVHLGSTVKVVIDRYTIILYPLF